MEPAQTKQNRNLSSHQLYNFQLLPLPPARYLCRPPHPHSTNHRLIRPLLPSPFPFHFHSHTLLRQLHSHRCRFCNKTTVVPPYSSAPLCQSINSGSTISTFHLPGPCPSRPRRTYGPIEQVHQTRPSSRDSLSKSASKNGFRPWQFLAAFRISTRLFQNRRWQHS